MQHADAEDVRQAVMIGLSSALRSFEYDPGRGQFRSYLLRATRNAMTRHTAPTRRANHPGSLEHAPPVVGDDGSAAFDDDGTWTRLWREHHLRRAFRSVRGSMASRSIEVFERLLAGDPLTAVAARFDMSEDAVAKIRQRVRSRLRDIVEAQISEENADVA